MVWKLRVSRILGADAVAFQQRLDHDVKKDEEWHQGKDLVRFGVVRLEFESSESLEERTGLSSRTPRQRQSQSPRPRKSPMPPRQSR